MVSIIITGEFSSNAVHCLDEKYTDHDVKEAGCVYKLGWSKGTVSEIFTINIFLLDSWIIFHTNYTHIFSQFCTKFLSTFNDSFIITIKLRAKENVCIDPMLFIFYKNISNGRKLKRTMLGSPPVYNIHTMFYSNG